MSSPPPEDPTPSRFHSFTRAQWAALADTGPRPEGGRSAPDGAPTHPVPDDELEQVYLPLCALLTEVAAADRHRARRLAACLGAEDPAPPFVVGVAGSVAVGKSTVAGRLQALLGEQPPFRSVDVMSTDSFLYPNDRLASLGLAERKGFPESYDRPRLTATLAAIRAGVPEVRVPAYSHRDYDIVPHRHQVIARPSVLIVEGLHVLEPGYDQDGAGRGRCLVSDFLDWSIYVDADEADLFRWHCERLLAIHRTGSAAAPGFLGWFCSLNEGEARAVAEHSWWRINSVNLRDHIAPTRVRASMVLTKGADHRVTHVAVRTR